ncbi:hypothetical protein GCK32_001524 [Trichostrongylus colubriformis]|uniref:Uncharacterized protein n=1 Tax=Trichostrongylus colubriformis TaxID=6319 RepID=A0AAN8FE21_TRICO
MNKVLLVLLVMLSLSMVYAATAKGKTAAKDVAKKHSDKMIPDIVKKLEAIEKEKSPTERRKQILALIRKNPKAFVAAVSIYFRKYRIPVRRLPIPV